MMGVPDDMLSIVSFPQVRQSIRKQDFQLKVPEIATTGIADLLARHRSWPLVEPIGEDILDLLCSTLLAKFLGLISGQCSNLQLSEC